MVDTVMRFQHLFCMTKQCNDVFITRESLSDSDRKRDIGRQRTFYIFAFTLNKILSIWDDTRLFVKVNSIYVLQPSMVYIDRVEVI